MSAIVVQKYGGSSVASPEKIRIVAKRIADTRAKGRGVVVVVSAMGGTTDDLLSIAKQVTTSPPRRELDMLLTCGERASMALLSMAVQAEGYEAISFTGSQCGILTNDRHSGARIIEVRPVRVQDELERGRVVIVAGFQGVSYKREITTLGRGGSDTTAVALAAALGAEYCEICSDVDGVFTADPRIVSAARLIDTLSHGDMLELAGAGAKVLHAESLEFARRGGIALYARRTDGESAGTRIVERIDRPVLERPVISVAAKKGLHEISTGEPDRVFSELSRRGIDVFLWRQGADHTLLYLSDDDVPRWSELKAWLEGAGAGVRGQRAAVSVIGDGVGTRASSAATVTRLVCELDGEVVVGGRTRVTAVVDDSVADELVRRLHGALIEGDS